VSIPDEIWALSASGVTLSVDGERLKVTAPEALPEEIMDVLRGHKAEIIATLRDQAHAAPTALAPIHDARDPHGVPTAPCATCGALQWRAESRDWQWVWVCGHCWPEVSDDSASSLPPVHDTDDPWAKPRAPCAACGATHWRVWCHDERKVWQWICSRCRPLVITNPDGTRWRA
jgi:hypothetical protein